MKQLLLFSVAALLVAGLTACGQPAATTPTATTVTEASTTLVTTTSLAPSPTTTASATLISQADAKSAAFARAGVREAQVTRLSVELDFDDDRRRWEYDIEFHVDHVEYSVEVDAETGAVTDFERDYD